MRILMAAALLAVALPQAAEAGGYYSGGYYGGGYRCGNSDRLRSDYNRLQRSYDTIRRQLAGQSQACQQRLSQQHQAYQQVINQHRGVNADLIVQNGETAALAQTIAENNGVPPELLNRPTREEYDDLEERYERLLRAYRNLERDYRDVTER